MRIADLKNELYELDVMDMHEFQRMRDYRFEKLVRHHYENNPAYRSLLNENGISEGNLPERVSEIGRLPITEREWFEKVRIHENPSVRYIIKKIETTGSTGMPFLFPYSKKVAEKLAGELFARSILMAGIEPEETTYSVTHWFPGGKDVWASHEAMLQYARLGGKCIDESTQTPLQQHIKNMIENGVKYSVSGPPFYNALASVVKGEGLEDRIKLEVVAAGGGGVLDEDHLFVKDALSLRSYRLFYVVTEGGGIGVQVEEKGPYCLFSDGHVIEVVDKHLNPVKEGETGRILITPFDMDSVPVIRYVLGDEVRYLGERPFEGYSKFVPVIDNIRRFKDALIGGGLLPLSQIEEMPKYMRKGGVIALGVQIAKRTKGRKDWPIIRLEVPPGQDPGMLKKSAIKVFRKNIQMDFLIKSKEIEPPAVEVYGPGELRGKRLKPTLFVDETGR